MSNGLENIKHIIVLMFENRSFDNVLGWLYDSQNAPPFNQVPAGQSFEGLNPIPLPNSFTYDGISYAFQPRHGTDMTQPNPDPNEIYQHVYMQMFNPLAMPPQIPDPPTAAATMLGFLADYATAANVNNPTQTPNIMNCFRPADVPVMSELAYWYSVCDHWYASVPSQTFTNRSFVHAGTASGYVNNQIGDFVWDIWKNDTATIFNLMEQNSPGSWRVYYGGISELCNAYTCQKQLQDYGPDAGALRRFYPMSDFYTDLQNYQSDPEQYPFPSYVFIEPNFFSMPFIGAENDEHPQTVDTLDGASNVLWGEQLLADVFNALTATDLWSSTLFVATFDEHGGTYDHYAPQPATAIRPDNVVIASGQPGYSGFMFDRYGVRVPAVVMSPWIPKATVCNTVFDHTSIINTVCATFLNGAHLLARDQVANNLGPLLTCTSARTDLPTLQPRTPPAFDPFRCADVALTDFQKHLIAAGLQTRGANAAHRLETHADVWRLLETLAK